MHVQKSFIRYKVRVARCDQEMYAATKLLQHEKNLKEGTDRFPQKKTSESDDLINLITSHKHPV